MVVILLCSVFSWNITYMPTTIIIYVNIYVSDATNGGGLAPTPPQKKK